MIAEWALQIPNLRLAVGCELLAVGCRLLAVVRRPTMVLDRIGQWAILIRANTGGGSYSVLRPAPDAGCGRHDG